ncbi:hypothetical protein [uncultured Desulfuromonas sp.]|uniref:hypothetical protein n=1 Tax=uncultured Desulfuromonas sp. TaxID=181013 RepID=UPI002AABCE01|nr:hypothetical protein [uncultured Desulfuromonas sp.]
MTVRKSYKHIFSTLCLILMLFICQTNIYGFVWCFCDQDNVKLEQLHFDCNQQCASEQNNQADDHQSHHIAQKDHTGPCLDLLTSGSYTSRQRHDLFNQPITPLILPTTPVVSMVGETAGRPQLTRLVEPRVSQHILHHRTIVLRH